jgi:hypothetical protein
VGYSSASVMPQSGVRSAVIMPNAVTSSSSKASKGFGSGAFLVSFQLGWPPSSNEIFISVSYKMKPLTWRKRAPAALRLREQGMQSIITGIACTIKRFASISTNRFERVDIRRPGIRESSRRRTVIRLISSKACACSSPSEVALRR